MGENVYLRMVDLAREFEAERRPAHARRRDPCVRLPMRRRPLPAPRLHLFVCANRREGSPLGPGCGERGDLVYDALKREVAVRGAVAEVWVTKTHCLGVCPARGTTVARYSSGERHAGTSEASTLVTEVEPTEAAELLDEAEEHSVGAPSEREHRDVVAREILEREIQALEELQRKKVLDLARRLKPGLTLEDVQNPHDFPELDDPDWHYADGVLTGIASVKSTLAALAARAKKDA